MIVEAIYSTCYNYLCFFIVIITTEKNAWMRVLLLITNQGVVLIEKKKTSKTSMPRCTRACVLYTHH